MSTSSPSSFQIVFKLLMQSDWSKGEKTNLKWRSLNCGHFWAKNLKWLNVTFRMILIVPWGHLESSKKKEPLFVVTNVTTTLFQNLNPMTFLMLDCPHFFFKKNLILKVLIPSFISVKDRDWRYMTGCGWSNFQCLQQEREQNINLNTGWIWNKQQATKAWYKEDMANSTPAFYIHQIWYIYIFFKVYGATNFYVAAQDGKLRF